MAAIFSSDLCTLISHEEYIGEVYKNTLDGKAFKFKDVLFEVTKPFKKHRQKRKAPLQTSLVDLKTDSEFVHNNYSKFYEVLKQNEQSIPIADCEISLNVTKAVSDLLEKSKSNLRTNVNGTNAFCQMVAVDSTNYLFPENCTFYSKDVRSINQHVSEKFDLILLDPPWWNKAVRRKKFSDEGYDMMYNEDLLSIPIDELLEDNGLLVIWCTNSPQHLKFVVNDMLPKWKLSLSSKWFWMKITKNFEPIVNFCDPPAKQPFEQIFIASRNKGLVVGTKIVVSVPSTLHSHKPPLVELLKPYIRNGSKCLELFARYLLPGWTSYGLEVLMLQHEGFYQEVLPDANQQLLNTEEPLQDQVPNFTEEHVK